MPQALVVYSQVRQELHDLRRHLTMLRDQRELAELRPAYPDGKAVSLGAGIASAYTELGRRKREFDFKSVIISLYGAIEHFVKASAEEYVRELSYVAPAFLDLPESIKNRHLDLCVRLAARLLQSPDLADIKVSDIVRGAHEAEALNLSSKLVPEAFSIQTANVRTAVVDTIFASLGVGKINNRLSAAPAFDEEIPATEEISLFKLNAEGQFFYLDDLRIHRNFVAHGRPPNIIALEAMEPYLTFALAFCGGLNFVLCQELNRWARETRGIVLGRDPVLFPNLQVIGFPLLDAGVTVGAHVIRSSNGVGGRHNSCIVEEIRLSNRRVESASAGDQDVSIRVAPYPAGRGDFYVLADPGGVTSNSANSSTPDVSSTPDAQSANLATPFSDEHIQ